MKYSVLMPYYERANQLNSTLVSFDYHYSDRRDYELILIEDGKNNKNETEHRKLLNIIEKFKDRININYKISPVSDSYNPSALFNQAAKEAQGVFLVITNPECVHKVNILQGLDEEFAKDPGVYVVCGCESGFGFNLNLKSFDKFAYSHHMWYQHSKHRNVLYHFCTAISKENYFRIGGFDERFMEGIAYDDNDFRDNVIHNGITPILRDDLLVVHLEHQRFRSDENIAMLMERNKRLYLNKSRERSMHGRS